MAYITSPFSKKLIMAYMMCVTMPQKRKAELPPLDLGPETFGDRLKRFRKARGLTQTELAQRLGIRQSIISSYEIERIRPHMEMICHLALQLEITTDELLGMKQTKKEPPLPRRFLHRLQKVDSLTARQQDALLVTIDAFLSQPR